MKRIFWFLAMDILALLMVVGSLFWVGQVQLQRARDRHENQCLVSRALFAVEMATRQILDISTQGIPSTPEGAVFRQSLYQPLDELHQIIVDFSPSDCPPKENP